MKVEIQNFRCFRNVVEYEFSRGKLTLLKGHSGAGKSTILEAIRWCLFGSMRNIYPSGFNPSQNNKTFVNLEISNLKICRSQAPEVLTLKFLKSDLGNEVQSSIEPLTQEVAQKYIDSIFGNKSIWLASSFIRQNERCPLVVASNSERMTLLNEILFGGELENTPFENPDYYIEKIEDELEKTGKDITGKTAIFNTYYNKYVNLSQDFQNTYNWQDMTLEQIETYSKYIQDINYNIEDKTEELINISKLENQKRFLEEKMINLGNVSEVKEEDIQFLNLKVNEIQNKITKLINDKTKYESIQKEIDFQNSTLKSNHNELIKIQPLELNNEIVRIKSDILNLDREAMNIKSKDMRLQTLKLQIDSVNNDIKINEEKMNGYNVKDVEELKKILDNTLTYNTLKDLESKIDNIKSLISEYINEEDISSIESKTQNEHINLKYAIQVCQKYGLELKDVESKIMLYQQIVDFDKVQRQHLLNHKSYTDKSNEIQRLKDSLITDFSSYNEYIGTLESSSSSLTENTVKDMINLITSRLGSPLKCPHCSCVVEYNNGVLTPASTELIDVNVGKMRIEKLKELLNLILRNNTINNMILKCQTELSSIPSYDETVINAKQYTEAEIVSIQNLISECSRIKIDIGDMNISNLENKLINLKNLREYYRILKELNDAKNKYDIGVSTRQDISELRNEILTIPIILMTLQRLNENYSKINEEYNVLFNEMGSVDYNTVVNNSLSLKEKLTSLEQQYKDVLEAHKTNENIHKLYSSLIDIDILNITDENISKLEKEKNENQTKINEMKSCLILYKEYIRIKQELSNIILITTSGIVQSQIDTLKESLSQYTDIYNKAYHFYNLLQERKELENVRNNVMDMTNKQANLNIMKNLVIETVNGTLENLVISINNSVNSILEELFESNIVVELKLYKELKTGKNKIKPSINMSIYFNGNTFDNVSMLSGGEQARISLAFTLALASIHHSPIIFLDEVMGALNSDLREQCVDVIKKFLIETSNKTVISVEHNFIEGLFDDIIEVKT